MNKDEIPEEFDTIEQIRDFWDTHSTADYWDEMEDVEMELSPALKSKIKLRKLCGLHDLSEQYRKRLKEQGELDRPVNEIFTDLKRIREKIAKREYSDIFLS
jgi:hypothetical protein